MRLRMLTCLLGLVALAACGEGEQPAIQGKEEPIVESPEPAPTATQDLGEVEVGGVACGVIAEEPDLGAEHLGEGEPLPEGTARPATSGPHGPLPLPSDIQVYFEPFDPVMEAQAVHNLEHGYVLIYVMPDLLQTEVLEQLQTLAETEEKVILAPYDLGPDTALALVAWRQIQTCGPTVGVEEALGVTEAFIAQFRSGGLAPEPNVG